MTKQELEKKKSTARTLYMSGMEQLEIADKVGVSRNTICKWVQDGAWKEARAAKTVTRHELVNKLLLTIDDLVSSVNKSGDPKLINGLGDQLSKLMKTVEKLDGRTNVINAIEVFMTFNEWIKSRAKYDPEITPELVKAINKYQDLFLSDALSRGTIQIS
ncbi:MAG: hypothetical protein NC117_09975 [Pseudoflavonifractor sp.]|nr:hypothetical protein [Pseudoflavonifractor sp.]